MGMYDEIEVGERRGQVKLWDNQLRVYRVGDVVEPPRLAVHTYMIAMREGGYVHVVDDKITLWDDLEPVEGVQVFDKWGDPWVSERENIGEIGRELRDLGVAPIATYFFERR